MKTKQIFIGIDISKSTLDICNLAHQAIYTTIDNNNKKSIQTFIKELFLAEAHCHICVENTGKYGWLLIDLLSKKDCSLYVVNPIHLKKSLGLVRGKNDKIDAFRIANFIKKNHEDLNTYTPKSSKLKAVQVLLKEREHKVKQRKELRTKLRDYQLLNDSKLQNLLASQNRLLINEMSIQIKAGGSNY